MAITSTRPLDGATPADVVLVEDGQPVDGPVGQTPMEAAMHTAIYAARPDVRAICRGHPPAVVLWGTGVESLPLLHGLGALAGDVVRVHDDIELVKDSDRGTAVATTLGDDTSVLLRANGALSVGPRAIEAATSLYFLEERARVAIGARSSEVAKGWPARLEDTAAEMVRAAAWFESRFGDQQTGAK